MNQDHKTQICAAAAAYSFTSTRTEVTEDQSKCNPNEINYRAQLAKVAAWAVALYLHRFDRLVEEKTLMEIADDRRARMSQSYAFISIRMIASVRCHGVPEIRKSCSMQSIAFCCGGQACPHTD